MNGEANDRQRRAEERHDRSADLGPTSIGLQSSDERSETRHGGPGGDVDRETEMSRAGWLRIGKESIGDGVWAYRWRYDPAASRRQQRRQVRLAAISLMAAGALTVTGVIVASGGRSNDSPAVPLNSEGRPAVGPATAPPDDPCWDEAERAARLIPEDGGRILLPQRCLDKGF